MLHSYVVKEIFSNSTYGAGKIPRFRNFRCISCCEPTRMMMASRYACVSCCRPQRHKTYIQIEETPVESTCFIGSPLKVGGTSSLSLFLLCMKVINFVLEAFTSFFHFSKYLDTRLKWLKMYVLAVFSLVDNVKMTVSSASRASFVLFGLCFWYIHYIYIT